MPQGPLRDGEFLGMVRVTPRIDITHLSFGDDATNALSIGFDDAELTGDFPDLTSFVESVINRLQGALAL